MRGQMYSIIAIMIIIPMIIFMVNYVASQSRAANIYQKIVSDQIHQVERSAELDFGRALATSGKRALIAGADYVVVNGEPLDDSETRIRELMENGSVFSNESLFMYNNTLDEWVTRILNVGTNFIVELNYTDISISMYNSTQVEMSSELNVSVYDILGSARIDRIGNRYGMNVSLDGIGDPLYVLNTNGLITRVIRLSPYPYRGKELVSGSLSSGNCQGTISFNVSDSSGQKILVVDNTSGLTPADLAAFEGVVIQDPEDLTASVSCFVSGNSSAIDLINDSLSTGYDVINIDNQTNGVWHLPIRDEIASSYYFPGSGPDMLSRMEGSLSGSGIGLESIVDSPALQSYGIPIKPDQVSVDYLYFSNQDYNGCPVRGLPGWLRLNAGFANTYGVSDLLEVC
jgi:hypothetical protein